MKQYIFISSHIITADSYLLYSLTYSYINQYVLTRGVTLINGLQNRLTAIQCELIIQ